MACNGQKKNKYRVLVVKPEGRRQPGRCKNRWEDNIQTYLKGSGRDGMTGFIWLRTGTTDRFLWTRKLISGICKTHWTETYTDLIWEFWKHRINDTHKERSEKQAIFCGYHVPQFQSVILLMEHYENQCAGLNPTYRKKTE